ncbi:hypothetical protein [Thermococcus sp.]|uniref:hypothetical protein n=1 Tax=Thermococcus sp. TaxID=35749 RepID=UPI00260E3300|nr:hypothetical protein [Thermococcus sp.]
MEPFQVHAIVQAPAFFNILAGIHHAKKHNMRRHHAFSCLGIGLLTLGVAYMLSIVEGIQSTHGALGIFTCLPILFTAFSGRLFLRKKLSRGTHRAMAVFSVLLLALQIFPGIYSFLL